jgi:hypothetical protein
VQLFTIIFQEPVPFGVATLMAGVLILLVARSIISTEDRAKGRFVRAITNANAKYLWTLLFVGWALVLGIGLQLVPHEGANSPYGGIGLIAMFTGFFVMMGFLWSVIGE